VRAPTLRASKRKAADIAEILPDLVKPSANVMGDRIIAALKTAGQGTRDVTIG
jgi:hypothetical protein